MIALLALGGALLGFTLLNWRSTRRHQASDDRSLDRGVTRSAVSVLVFGLVTAPGASAGAVENGQLNLTPTGSPSSAPLQQMLADAGTLRGYGYIGDGASHPLSSITSFGGVSTMGWTLLQWQAALPAASAVSDEIDWAATQSYIQKATSSAAIHFPPGIGIFNKPLVVCRQSVSFYGQGGISYHRSVVSLHFTERTDGIDRCVGGPNTTIEIHNIQISAQADDRHAAAEQHTRPSDSVPTTGINDTSANLDFFDDVQIDGFANCLNLQNGEGTHLRFVFCHSGLASGSTSNTGIGIRITGSAAFINHWDNVLVQNYAVGYWFHSTNNYSGITATDTVGTRGQVGIEDTQVRDSACGGVRVCIRIDSADSKYGPFNYSFYNMSVDATSQFIDAPSVNNLIVIGGNWLIDAAIPGSTWGGTIGGTGDRAPLSMIDIGTSRRAAHMVRLRDMWFGQGSNVVIRSLITVEAQANDVQIIGNKIETAGMTVVDAYFKIKAGATQVIERDTSWEKSFAPSDPPANAISNEGRSPTNKLESVAVGTLSAENLSNCGASPSIKGTNTEGVIAEGLGATGCTLSFQRPLRSIAPVCVFQPTVSGKTAFTVSAVTAAIATYSHPSAALTVTYRCSPY